jgi:hypothetical protein
MVFQLLTGSRGPEVPAVGSALLRAETTVAETVEFLRRADPGQGLREPS